jgi:hypothetical protein
LALENPAVAWIGGWDGMVRRVNLELRCVTTVMRAAPDKDSPVRALALTPAPPLPKGRARKKKDGAAGAPGGGGSGGGGASSGSDDSQFILFVSHGTGDVKSWDLRAGKVLVDSYGGASDVVASMAVWNQRLYAAGDDRHVRVFDVHTGQLLESLSGHDNGVTCVCVAGVTPVLTPEQQEVARDAHAEAQRTARQAAAKAASAAAKKAAKGGSGAGSKTGTPSATSRGGGGGGGSAGGQVQQQQGVGNELLLTSSYDGTLRAFRLAAVDAALQLRALKSDEAHARAFDAFVANRGGAGSKKKKKKGGGKKGSGKGKGKGSGTKKSGGGSSKKKSSDGVGSGASKKGKKKSSRKKGTTTSAAAGAGSSSSSKKKKKSSKKKGKKGQAGDAAASAGGDSAAAAASTTEASAAQS